MKADRNGTWTEQVRARMGWVSPTVRKTTGLPATKVCVNCGNFWSKEVKNGDNNVDFKSYCGATQAGDGGFSTRDTATCDTWEPK